MAEVRSDGGEFKGWVPEPYLDEICPTPRLTPNAWLVLGDVARLAGFDDDDPPGAVVSEGEIVTFCSLVDYGTLVVEIAKDGTLAPDSDRPSPAARGFCLPGDPETFAETIEEFAKQQAEHFVDDDDFPVAVHVCAYTWCDGTAFVMRDGAFVEAA